MSQALTGTTATAKPGWDIFIILSVLEKQTNLYNAHKQPFLISFNGTLKTRLSIVHCVLNNLLMIIKDAQILPTVSALYLTKKIRVQEESKWSELDPRRRCYQWRSPYQHKDSKDRVKCSLNCTTDTQRGDAKTLECDYKSRRMRGFFFPFSP